ncbi:MAG: bifunctional metallophosphatase/5'-nucleotidase [Flammeovirgaceae bacterium]
MKRRKFIQTALLGSAALGTGLSPLKLWADTEVLQLTILHTNDMHSRIEPFPENARRNAGMGGMSRRAALIQKIRAEGNQVLLLDAGDIFQGTPYFNFFNGELEFKLMSHMGYDAATLGNHDFDAGLAGFIKQLPHASFQFVNANYTFEEQVLKSAIKPYKIFQKGPLKIGVFGLGIKLDGLVPKNLYGHTKYADPIGTAKEIVQELKRKKCHLIVCLSHLGNKYESDKVSDEVLAQSVEGIDLIIGGHTHTFMPKPLEYRNPQGRKVLVNQVGWAGVNLGRIDFFFSRQLNVKEVEGKALGIYQK